MTEQKIPSYVLKVDAAGRRFFKPEFVEMLVNDIRTEKTTVRKACDDFRLNETLVYRWLRGTGGGTPGGHRAHAGRKRRGTENGHTSILALAQKYTEDHGPKDVAEPWAVTPDHVRLAVAYCKGEVPQEAVNYALRKTGIARGKVKVMTTSWLGAVLRWALRHGYELKRG